MNGMTKDRFKDAIVYQVYTRSFRDSDGDGVGDFRGIIEKLDHIASLGVTVLWISPFCESPNVDNGYDISDYFAVMKEFGSMGDLDDLIAESRSRGIEIMMDLVMNHTSDRHPWFIESRSSRDNPKRDWYIWADSRGGKLPNNWESYFVDKAWTKDETTGSYYMHQFYAEQPDLNWNNPEVVREMIGMIRWWAEKGIRAFRLDAIHHIGKPADLRDAAEPRHRFGRRVICNTDETHTHLHDLAKNAFIPESAFTVGETGGTSFDDAKKYVDADREELDMVFHFEHVYPLEMSAKSLRAHFESWYEALSPKGWDAVFFSNHDLPRHISMFGDDGEYREDCAKSFAVMLFALWGTPFIYQGEEIGMTNVRFASIDDYPDPSAKRWIDIGMKTGLSRDEAVELYRKKNRDNARTPMQWSPGKNAGFTDGTPWIGINPNHKDISVEAQENDPDSVLSFYRGLAALRTRSHALRRGSFALFDAADDDVFAWSRSGEDGDYLMLVNFSARTVHAKTEGFSEYVKGTAKELTRNKEGKAVLRPWGSAILKK